MNICEKQNCTGCFACLNICPKICISMVEDEIGHIYPKIDEEKCINCGACQKICPNNNELNLKKPSNVYAAWSLNEIEHEKSTSGGVATYLTRKTIENGGIVYGCSSVVSDEIHHIRIDNLDNIKTLQGSKYVQSFINDAYKKAKEDLKNAKQVLFIGTPCQISGFKSYLGENYENLITIDLICHGVPSQKLLFDDIQNHITEGDKTLSFREKKGYYLKISDNTGITKYYKHEYDDLYYLGFDTALFYRESCYACKYANIKRSSDITIGDFWGLGKDIPFNYKIQNGVSVILINTDRGKQIFDKYKNGLFFEERTLNEAIKENANLNYPSKKNINAQKFVKIYKINGFKIASKKCLRKDIYKYKLLNILQKNKLTSYIIQKIR